jgi:hypothetical protein
LLVVAVPLTVLLSLSDDTTELLDAPSSPPVVLLLLVPFEVAVAFPELIAVPVPVTVLIAVLRPVVLSEPPVGRAVLVPEPEVPSITDEDEPWPILEEEEEMTVEEDDSPPLPSVGLRVEVGTTDDSPPLSPVADPVPVPVLLLLPLVELAGPDGLTVVLPSSSEGGCPIVTDTFSPLPLLLLEEEVEGCCSPEINELKTDEIDPMIPVGLLDAVVNEDEDGADSRGRRVEVATGSPTLVLPVSLSADDDDDDDGSAIVSAAEEEEEEEGITTVIGCSPSPFAAVLLMLVLDSEASGVLDGLEVGGTSIETEIRDVDSLLSAVVGAALLDDDAAEGVCSSSTCEEGEGAADASVEVEVGMTTVTLSSLSVAVVDSALDDGDDEGGVCAASSFSLVVELELELVLASVVSDFFAVPLAEEGELVGDLVLVADEDEVDEVVFVSTSTVILSLLDDDDEEVVLLCSSAGAETVTLSGCRLVAVSSFLFALAELEELELELLDEDEVSRSVVAVDVGLVDDEEDEVEVGVLLDELDVVLEEVVAASWTVTLLLLLLEDGVAAGTKWISVACVTVAVRRRGEAVCCSQYTLQYIYMCSLAGRSMPRLTLHPINLRSESNEESLVCLSSRSIGSSDCPITIAVRCEDEVQVEHLQLLLTVSIREDLVDQLDGCCGVA